MSDEPPILFGRYTFQKQLGHGGMGIVVLATDKVLERLVAIKVIRPEQKELEEARARFFREARLAAQLVHPNSVQIFDLGERDDGTMFLVMEYVEGKALAAYCGTPEPPVSRKLRWLVDIARGLAAGHKKGLVHRDMKPQNVMISNDGIAKVVDYGLAKRQQTNEVLRKSYRTELGFVVGTPAYMAPEQLSGQDVDARADQFAWGLTAYAVLAGKNPRALDPMLERPIPPLTNVEGVNEEAAHVFSRAVEKVRDARYPTMDDAALRLEEALMRRSHKVTVVPSVVPVKPPFVAPVAPVRSIIVPPPRTASQATPEMRSAPPRPPPKAAQALAFERREGACFVAPIELAAFSPDGERVVAFGRSQCAVYTYFSSWRVMALPPLVQASDVRCVALLYDGRMVLGGRGSLSLKIKPNLEVTRWADRSGGPLREFTALDVTAEGWVSFLAPSEGGSVVATVGDSGLSCVEVGARLRAVATAATGELVACGERGKLVYLTQARELVIDRLGESTLSAIARGRDRLYVVGYDGASGCVDPARGRVTRDPVSRVSFEHVAVHEDDVWAADDGGGIHQRMSTGEWVLRSPAPADTPKVRALWAGPDRVRALMHDGSMLVGRRA